MIPVPNPIPEPANFHEECRQRGNNWLSAHPLAIKDFPAYWTKFEEALELGFSSRCGWWAMWIAPGTANVDHFFSKAKPTNRHLIYEWSNYRLAAGTVNGSKKNHDDDLLDPFEVGADWFEVILPSMQLVCTSKIPANLRAKAEFTLDKLKLVNGNKVRRNRKRWYEAYKKWTENPNTGITMGALEEIAPLVAAAVKKQEAEERRQRDDCWTARATAEAGKTTGRIIE